MRKTKRRRWTILWPDETHPGGGRYLSPASGGDGILASDDTDTLRSIAGDSGIVVEAEWLSNHWHEWQKTKVIPKEARLPEETT